MRPGAGLALFTLAALAVLPALHPPPHLESFLYLVFLWVALATSWTILSGFAGYFSFGHAAFYGAGMYASASLAGRHGMPFLLTLPVAGLAAMALGVAVGAVVFRLPRLRGELFALLTLAITFVLATVVLNTPIDGGMGISMSSVTLPAVYAGSASTIYLLGLAVAALSMACAWSVQHSVLGRGLFAISDDESVAEVMGVPTFRYKLAALALSSSLAGVAGGIHSMFVSYVSVAETFSATVLLNVALMSLIGGARHWLGPAIGATFITALTHVFVGGQSALASRAVIGFTLIFAMLYLQQGLMGYVDKRRRRAPGRDARKESPQEQRQAMPAPPYTASAQRPRPVLLRCEGVHLAFQGVKALAGVDLRVREGEILGLVGPNGSGKSTLVNAISGLYRPDAGRIGLDDQDLAVMAAHRIARLGVARTFQIPRAFARLTVLENVALPATFGAASLGHAEAIREARHWLEFVGLAERAAALPSELNLQQRKFLELARALASRPRLLLLDEVLAGLTPAEIGSALLLVRRIRESGATIVFIEHNMRAVLQLTDRLVVLNYGIVIAEGPPREVIRQPGVVSAYLGGGYVHA